MKARSTHRMVALGWEARQGVGQLGSERALSLTGDGGHKGAAVLEKDPLEIPREG